MRVVLDVAIFGLPYFFGYDFVKEFPPPGLFTLIKIKEKMNYLPNLIQSISNYFEYDNKIRN